MEKPEQQWLALYRQGETDALGKLVEHFRRPLFAFILKMTEGAGDAEEVFQEVWFRAIRNIDRYRDKNFLSWLFRIARNLVIDRARRARWTGEMRSGLEEEEGDPFETRVQDKRIGPDAVVSGHDLGQRITAAVMKLPDEQREVFVMRTEAEIPFREIARIQGTSINTALARMQYALAKLKADLHDDYEALMRT